MSSSVGMERGEERWEDSDKAGGTATSLVSPRGTPRGI